MPTWMGLPGMISASELFSVLCIVHRWRAEALDSVTAPCHDRVDAEIDRVPWGYKWRIA